MEAELEQKLGHEQKLDDLIDQDDLRQKKGKGKQSKGKNFVKNDSSEEEEVERPKRTVTKKKEEMKKKLTQEAEKDMEQSGDDIDLDDKILESTQRQPESAVANAAYDNENEDMDGVLDSVSPEKDLDDHHSPRSDEAEP